MPLPPILQPMLLLLQRQFQDFSSRRSNPPKNFFEIAWSCNFYGLEEWGRWRRW
jgi:hypothetical protein